MKFFVCTNCGFPSIENYSICKVCGSSLEGSVDGNQLAGAILEDTYELINYIDEGAMSWVYKGEHMKLGSSVAIKILKPAFSSDERFSKRFQKEAVTASSLNHPNILSVFTIGDTLTGISYIVSEFISGQPLSSIISKEKVIPLKRAIPIILQILSALDEAHSHNIIHRDIKPENIMVTKLRSGEDFIKLVDFGIAYISTETSAKRLTKYGELFGTPEYMSPETIKGNDATHLSDLYSVGMIMYEMLTGVLPVEGQSIFDVLKAHLDGNFAPPSQINPKLSPVIDTLLDKALSIDPKQRFSSASEFKVALQKILNSKAYKIECKICGETVDSTHKFCPHCGSPIEVKSQLPADKRGKRISLNTSNFMETMDRILKLEQEIPEVYLDRPRETNIVNNFFQNEKTTLMISGQVGIGKTTFINKMISLLSNDIITYSVMSDPYYLQRPWYPIRKLIFKILGLRENTELDLIISSLNTYNIAINDIPHIIDFIRHEYWNPKTIEHNIKQRELVTSLTRLILSVSESKSLLLVFDDFDNYDYPSRYFINYLIQNISKYPIKLILIGESLSAGLIEGSQQLVMTRIDIQDAFNHIINIMNNRSDSWVSLIDILLKQSMGLPLHIREGLHLLAEGGDEVNLNLYDIISVRLNRLPSRSLELLRMIALYGIEVPSNFIFSDIENNDILINAFKVLVKRGFISQNNVGSIRLSQQSYVSVIENLTPTSLKREIHKKIFNRLNKNDKDYVYFSAYHLFKSLDMDLSIKMLEKAGDLSEKELDDFSALHYYKKAWELLKIRILKEDLYEDFASLSCKLGNIYRYTKQYKQAEEVLKEGLVFTEANSMLEARLLSSLARLEIEKTNHKRAITLINKAIKKLKNTQTPELVYQVYFDFSIINEFSENMLKSYNKIQDATNYFVDISRRPHNYWRLFIKLSQIEFEQGNQNAAISTLMNLISIKDIRENVLAVGRIHFQVGLLLKKMNRNNDAVVHLNKSLEYLEKIGDRKGAAEAAIVASEASVGETRSHFLKQALLLSMQIGWIKGIHQARHLLEANY